jgi:hypothetical protein
MLTGVAARGLGGPAPVNKSLLDTDTLSEIIKGIDPTIGRNAAAYPARPPRWSSGTTS